MLVDMFGTWQQKLENSTTAGDIPHDESFLLEKHSTCPVQQYPTLISSVL